MYPSGQEPVVPGNGDEPSPNIQRDRLPSVSPQVPFTRVVTSNQEKSLAVGPEGQCLDRATSGRDATDFLPAVGSPEADIRIESPGGQPLAVRGDGDDQRGVRGSVGPISLPVETSQIRTVPSAPPDARR